MRLALHGLTRPPARHCRMPPSTARGLPGLPRREMSSPPGRTYADAIDVLNTLQTPFAELEARRKAGARPDARSLAEMEAYWARLGHRPEDLDRLNVVHVAGTKGKGSVCAFVASILAQHAQRGPAPRPRRIGLLTSPHLIAVRERIRLDGEPIGEALFARYFFELFDRLSSPPAPPARAARPDAAPGPAPGSKPLYARFLTLLAFHVFVREGVDAAVVETGVGGAFDATNIVPRPRAAGVATLGIDHVFVLGATIDRIAWHKAGIFKRGAPALAVAQPAFPAAEAVLRARAAEVGVAGGALRLVADDERLARVRVRPDAAFQRRNASLAVALAEVALEAVDPDGLAAARREVGPGRLPAAFKEGIERVVWRGRCEVKEEGAVRWHLDGAHTTDSLKVAAQWFTEECKERAGPRVLVFNQQGRTEAIDFLDGLHAGAQRAGTTPTSTSAASPSPFDLVLFCTNRTHAATGYQRDFVNHQDDPAAVANLTVQRQFAARWAELDPRAEVRVVGSIEEAIAAARGLAGGDGGGLREGDAVLALITGSLHLVGGALGILEGADAL